MEAIWIDHCPVIFCGEDVRVTCAGGLIRVVDSWQRIWVFGRLIVRFAGCKFQRHLLNILRYICIRMDNVLFKGFKLNSISFIVSEVIDQFKIFSIMYQFQTTTSIRTVI